MINRVYCTALNLANGITYTTSTTGNHTGTLRGIYGSAWAASTAQVARDAFGATTLHAVDTRARIARRVLGEYAAWARGHAAPMSIFNAPA